MKRLAVLLLALLVWMPSLAPAAVLETNEWDNLTRTDWSYCCGSKPSIDATVTSPSGGNTLKFHYEPGTYSASTGGGKADYAALTGQEVYVGHWIKWSSNWVWHPIGSKVDYAFRNLFSFTNQSTAAFTIHFLPGGQTMVFTSNIQGNGVFYPGTPHDYRVALPDPIQFNRWYWFEYRLKLNAVTSDTNPPTYVNVVPNGELQFWLDDVQIINRSDVRWTDRVGDSWHNALHSPEYGGGGTSVIPTPGIDLWMDHTVISTTRIGRPGVGGDTTAPVAPANFIVR